MIFVNTSEEVAQQRNQERKRTLPRDEVTKMWNGTKKHRCISAFLQYQKLYHSRQQCPNDDVLDMPLREFVN